MGRYSTYIIINEKQLDITYNAGNISIKEFIAYNIMQTSRDVSCKINYCS